MHHFALNISPKSSPNGTDHQMHTFYIKYTPKCSPNKRDNLCTHNKPLIFTLIFLLNFIF